MSVESSDFRIGNLRKLHRKISRNVPEQKYNRSEIQQKRVAIISYKSENHDLLSSEASNFFSYFSNNFLLRGPIAAEKNLWFIYTNDAGLAMELENCDRISIFERVIRRVSHNLAQSQFEREIGVNEPIAHRPTKIQFSSLLRYFRSFRGKAIQCCPVYTHRMPFTWFGNYILRHQGHPPLLSHSIKLYWQDSNFVM